MANPPAAIINSENKTENLTRRPSNLLESTLAAFVEGDNFRHDASLTYGDRDSRCSLSRFERT